MNDWIERDEICCPYCGEYEDQYLESATLTDGDAWKCGMCYETYTVTTKYKVEK